MFLETTIICSLRITQSSEEVPWRTVKVRSGGRIRGARLLVESREVEKEDRLCYLGLRAHSAW